MSTENINQQEEVHNKVREGYAEIARKSAEPAEDTGCCSGSSCCSPDLGESAEKLAELIGYSEEELADLPDGANMGLSCGNPVALATLKPGEVAVDLGAGGGFDVFIAGKKVGPEGRAIGVDMTPEMLSKARQNTTTYQERTGLSNVEFRLGEIEALPLPDNSVDVILSNCVINLSPDKPRVWKEMNRVLKPGGRVAVSDIMLKKPLPDGVRGMVEALVGCVAGAVLADETEQYMREACFADIAFEEKAEYIDGMIESKDHMYGKIVEMLPEGAKLSDYVASMNISAKKPGGCCCG